MGYLLGSATQNSEIKTSTQTIAPHLKGILSSSIRDVHVGTMCRCGSAAFPAPGRLLESSTRNTDVVQPPSKATGLHQSKRFIMHHRDGVGCTCIENHEAAEPTKDDYMSTMERRCPNQLKDNPATYDWNEMPDFGVEESLPLFVGVLSYKTPLSLHGTLQNWRGFRFLQRIKAADVFVQLNRRSERDDEVMAEYQRDNLGDPQPHPLTLMGSADENLHPGLSISKFCRAAEAHPNGHPNGENLLLFLEKDWNLDVHFQSENNGYPGEKLHQLFNSINALIQRGVHLVRLGPLIRQNTWEHGDYWECPSQGVPWRCATSHKHRYANLPAVIDCKWFLRYLEPFALLDDPIMYGCRPGFQENHYCDWEEAATDGRIAWTNSQWVVAALSPLNPRLFRHKEIDG